MPYWCEKRCTRTEYCKLLTCIQFCIFSDKKRLLVVTVATNATDGFTRYMRSAKKNGLNVKVSSEGTCVIFLCDVMVYHAVDISSAPTMPTVSHLNREYMNISLQILDAWVQCTIQQNVVIRWNLDRSISGGQAEWNGTVQIVIIFCYIYIVSIKCILCLFFSLYQTHPTHHNTTQHIQAY